ncbi:MAG: biopolymer transporter ExbD [Litorimonas sp.]
MSRRLNRVSQSDRDGVDMTPMLDIVFILLIFFIVTAVFLDERGVDFTQAQGDTPSGPDRAISIIVNAENVISVEGRVVPIMLVESEVQRHLVNRPGAAIDLRADKTARLESVVTIKDDMEQAGRAVRFETFSPVTLSAQLN